MTFLSRRRDRKKRPRELPCCDLLDGCDCAWLLFVPGLLRLVGTRTPPGRARAAAGTAARAGGAAIRGYQRWLSPRLPTRCRHVPTCSVYGAAVVERYGLWSGSRLTAERLGRCRPTVPYGTLDPPP
ncbi:hypothetical protein GCM10010123_23400 [Pilimelia anulata]|uniref:Membrane protein insertion efficiency factor n=1 Tax=Pilimelia anulata TaxID=53371 RepID=A0A8J3BAU3_9ACTN|nr:membrane protein insertion efficiency factor YidD [Pilimelia anulata]GGJ92819.1 hypothetical protein GCM10010123_23400 [Pilimelia anulata]